MDLGQKLWPTECSQGRDADANAAAVHGYTFWVTENGRIPYWGPPIGVHQNFADSYIEKDGSVQLPGVVFGTTNVHVFKGLFIIYAMGKGGGARGIF